MNNGEFFNSSESNKTTEYKYFPAEIYRKNKEENHAGVEEVLKGDEITTLQRNKKTLKDEGDTGRKRIIDKVFSSIKAVSTSATVAVTAVVVTTTLVISTPNVDLKSLDVGSDYIEYEMEISDLDENSSYSIVVSTSNEESVEFEVEENGTYKNRVEGLKPQWEYTLSLVCHDTALGDVAYYEIKLQTLKFTEQQPNPPPEPEPEPIPPPDTYTGTMVLPSGDEITVNWNEMTIYLPIKFENVDEKYYFKLIAANQNGEIIHTESHKNDYTVSLPITESVQMYNFTLEIYGIGENEEKLISTHALDTLEINKPSANITDIKLQGENLIRVYLDSQNVSELDLVITYPNGEESVITVTPTHILQGYCDIEVLDSALTVNVTPKIKLDGYTLTEESYTHTFENNLEATAVVDLYQRRVVFYVRYIGNSFDRIKIVNSLDIDNPTEEYLYNGTVNGYYDEQGITTYTLYLTNENGDILSNQVEITVDTSTTLEYEYEFNYVNPNSVAVSYNDDGTINAIIPATFESENSEIYYMVDLGGNLFKSNESTLVATNLKNKSYGITYYVCADVDGIAYSMLTVTPSGVINEFYIEDVTELSIVNNELTLTVYSFYNYDLDSIVLASSSGEKISLTSSDFTYNEEYFEYTARVSFENEFEFITVKGRCAPYKESLELLEDYQGNVYLEFEIVFENEGEY